MNISRKSWYVRLFFLMSWFNTKAFAREDPIEDPTDICPMMRMILLWGPLSIIVLLFYATIVIGIILGLVSVVLAMLAMPFLEVMVKILLVVITVICVIAVICVMFAMIWSITWCTQKIRQSALGTWWRKHLPKRVAVRQPEEEPESPREPSVFWTWVSGQLHGWCSPLTIVD